MKEPTEMKITRTTLVRCPVCQGGGRMPYLNILNAVPVDIYEVIIAPPPHGDGVQKVLNTQYLCREHFDNLSKVDINNSDYKLDDEKEKH